MDLKMKFKKTLHQLSCQTLWMHTEEKSCDFGFIQTSNLDLKEMPFSSPSVFVGNDFKSNNQNNSMNFCQPNKKKKSKPQ